MYIVQRIVKRCDNVESQRVIQYWRRTHVAPRAESVGIATLLVVLKIVFGGEDLVALIALVHRLRMKVLLHLPATVSILHVICNVKWWEGGTQVLIKDYMSSSQEPSHRSGV